jgi:phosphinothricin acetyltransferase
MPQIPAEVQVRPGVEADLRARTGIYDHDVLETALTCDTASFTPQERLPWFRSHPQDGPHGLLVALDPDTRHDTPHVLGYATSGPYRPKAAYSTSVEVSVHLAPGATGWYEKALVSRTGASASRDPARSRR